MRAGGTCSDLASSLTTASLACPSIGLALTHASNRPEPRLTKTSFEAAHGADCLVIMTEWDEFRQLDLAKLAKTLASPLVVDGRNVYDLEEMAEYGFTYLSVGRPAVRP
mgnify:CR=1 FL=1